MTDWVTISSLATGAGTLVLAVATFSSVRSANRTARIAEQSLLVGLRPVLIPSREDDPVQRVRFGDARTLTVPGHGAALEVGDGNVYMALALRNGGAGLAVLHGWQASVPSVKQIRTDPTPRTSTASSSTSTSRPVTRASGRARFATTTTPTCPRCGRRSRVVSAS